MLMHPIVHSKNSPSQVVQEEFFLWVTIAATLQCMINISMEFQFYLALMI